MASGFTFLCLAMSLCLGMFVEFLAYLDSMNARAARREALGRWNAAHYCGAHDVVFLRGEPVPYAPAAFAQQMHLDAAPAPAASAAASANG